MLPAHILRQMDPDEIALLVARAMVEDVGSGDVTTAATVPDGARATATITQKAPGVISGLRCAHMAFAALDPDVRVEMLVEEGVWREDGGPVMSGEGAASEAWTYIYNWPVTGLPRIASGRFLER